MDEDEESCSCEIDQKKMKEGAELISKGLQLMRDADPHSAPGIVLSWALCYGTASMSDGYDASGIHVMVPVEGISWPLILGIVRGAQIKIEREWINMIEGG